MTLRFQFKPAARADKTLIIGWLSQDYIRQWIHGAGLDSTLTGLDDFITHHEKTQVISRNDSITQHWIGDDGDVPLVYLLTSNVLSGEDSIYAKHKSDEGHAITLDIFIINPDYLGRGLATEIISQFLQEHFADVSEVFIDPEKANRRAIHVYKKLGFEKIDEFIAPWHPIPHCLMRLRMIDLSRDHVR